MAVTAMKLGQAPLTMDWTNLSAVTPGVGVASRTHEPSDVELAEAWQKLKSRFHVGDVGFYLAPTQSDISQVRETQALVARLLSEGWVRDVLFLGIGGSSLGPISLLQALQHKSKSSIRFHFQENPDPIDWKETLKRLSPETTVVCCVTKSGTTFETLAQLLIALEWLGKDRWSRHCIAVTDPEKGDLLKFARQNQIPLLSIHPSLGGRFSVFSPVGLIALAFKGLNCEEFLLGAKQVFDFCEKAPVLKNPLLVLSSHFLAHFQKRPIHVCMPYATPLRSLAQWWVQLWGESLGKDKKGFTPIAALGATDQHSILQLLRDGPDDKITFFITVNQTPDPVAIPKLPLAVMNGLPAFQLLEGHTLQELLSVEYQAIARVLMKQGRPHFTLQMDSIDERSMGALMFSMAVCTAFTGVLWDVNPFDQPGVEEGKVYIRESLTDTKNKLFYSTPEDADRQAALRLRIQSDRDQE